MAPTPLVYLVSALIVFFSLYSAWLITRMYNIKSTILFIVLAFLWPVTWVAIPVYLYRKYKAKKRGAS